MRSLILLFAVLVAASTQAQSLEYEALQAQISRDFGIAPTSMKITIEIEGDVQESGPIETVTPSVEIKVADDPVVESNLPVMTFAPTTRFYTAPTTRYYTAPTTRYYTAPVTRVYSTRSPMYYQSYPTSTNSTRNWSFGLGNVFGVSGATRTYSGGG